LSPVVLSFVALSIAVIALVRAVLDHYEYNKRFREYQRRILNARRSLRQYGDLANEIAHEIKNPLSAILCSAETLDLLIGKDLDPIHRKSLMYIKEYGDNLLRLVSDFLDVNRAETGKIEAKPEAVQVSLITSSIIGLLQSNAIKKQITVKEFISDKEMMAFVDQKHLKQVLFNLIHNAIKFTPENGEIHVVAKCDFPNPFVKILVKDNGAGISEHELEHLFDPYAKSDGHNLNLDVGVGLGLALCKSLVELNKGNIDVKSKRGVGTSFEFRIPLFKEVKAAAPELSNIDEDVLVGAERPLFGQRFLVVDEDTGARETLSRLIEAWGGMVDRVAMAVDAVQALEHGEYDAVMIDDTKDGVYGYELARIIRDDYQMSATKIIVTPKINIDEKCMQESGADSCISKPFNGKILLASLIKSGKYSTTH